METKNSVLIILIAAFIFAGIYFFTTREIVGEARQSEKTATKTATKVATGTDTKTATNDFLLSGNEIVVYKTKECGCCHVYVQYLDRQKANVRSVDVTDLSIIKKQYGVPDNLQSCHTSIVGNYFVEGHIPVEIVEKLLAEKPDIKGIALPGMPSGSPGMPGPKMGEWIIYAVQNDGSITEFTNY